MCGVLHDAAGPPPASLSLEVQSAEVADLSSALCRVFQLAPALPHGDAGVEDVLHRTVVKTSQDGASQSSSSQLPVSGAGGKCWHSKLGCWIYEHPGV